MRDGCGSGLNRLPDRFGLDPGGQSRMARFDFGDPAGRRGGVDAAAAAGVVAIVLNGVPLDAVVAELGTNRNAIYKKMFDVRGMLRAAVAANGFVDTKPANTEPMDTQPSRRP